MPKFNSLKLIEERAIQFKPFLGKGTIGDNGKVEFPGDYSMGYAVKSSLMSKNYLLSLQSQIETAPLKDHSKAICNLNRLGKWSLKGKSPVMRALCERIKASKAIAEQLKQTDLDSISVVSEEGKISLRINLYGGGFSAVVLPPMRVKIGIPDEQIQKSAKLLKLMHKEILKIA